MQDYPKILWEAYEQFLLPLGGKKIPTPYRRNEVGSFQKVGPQFQGKSSPKVLTETTKKLAKGNKFNLDQASKKEIISFMQNNKLGIDCSGFAYRALDHLTEKLKGKPLTAFGLPHVGRTNIAKLTSDKFSISINKIEEIHPGDMLKINSSQTIPHVMVILDVKQNRMRQSLFSAKITYAHSSETKGVHIGEIKIVDKSKSLNQQEWQEKYLLDNWSSDLGDGVKRLKVLG